MEKDERITLERKREQMKEEPIWAPQKMLAITGAIPTLFISMQKYSWSD